MDFDLNSKLQLSFLSFFLLPTRTTQLYTSYSKLSTPYRLSRLFSTPAAQMIATVEPDSPPSPRNRRKIGSIVSTSPKTSGTPHHLSPLPHQKTIQITKTTTSGKTKAGISSHYVAFI